MLVLSSLPAWSAAPWTGATADDLAAWMKSAGYDAEVKPSAYEGEHYLESRVDGQEFDIFLADCRADGQCGSLTFFFYLDAGIERLRNVEKWGRYRTIKILHDDTGFYAQMQLSLADFPNGLATGFAAWGSELPELLKVMAAPVEPVAR
jgi:hypothetical protein